MVKFILQTAERNGNKVNNWIYVAKEKKERLRDASDERISPRKSRTEESEVDKVRKENKK